MALERYGAQPLAMACVGVRHHFKPNRCSGGRPNLLGGRPHLVGSGIGTDSSERRPQHSKTSAQITSSPRPRPGLFFCAEKNPTTLSKLPTQFPKNVYWTGENWKFRRSCHKLAESQ